MTTPTQEQIQEQNTISIYDFIKKELEQDNTKNALDLAKEYFSDNETAEKTARIFLKLAETYPNEKSGFIALAKTCNKSFVTTTANYLQRIKEYKPENNYFCNVFKQTDERNKTATPLKFPRGTLSYIGARTHRGKTTALISIAIDAIMQKQKVYFFTSEETAEQIITRMIKAIFYTFFCNKETFNDVDDSNDLEAMIFDYLQKYNAPAIQDELTQDKGLKERYKKIIFNNSEHTINAQQAIYFSYWILCDIMKQGYFTIIDGLQQRTFDELIESLKLVETGSIILLDYIQHLKNPTNAGGSNRQVIIQNESMQLADISGLNDLIVIAGGQFNRNGEKAESEADKWKADFLAPTLFRESGDIEQDAHLIIGLGQQADKNTPKTPKRFYEVLKQRGHAQDGNKYAIADNSKYSLFSCIEQDNTLDFFTPIDDSKKSVTPKDDKQKAMLNFQYGEKRK